MAEICDKKSVLKTRNYKAIVSSIREIRDPNPDLNRRFTSLLVTQHGSLLVADIDSQEVCIFIDILYIRNRIEYLWYF